MEKAALLKIKNYSNQGNIRIICVLIFLLFVTITGFAQNNPLDKSISISFDNITLKEALDLLREKAAISVAYNNNLEALNYKITKTYADKSIDHILNDMLAGKDLWYKLIGDKITIYATKNRKNMVTISGYVYDEETGEILIACSVYDKASFIGTSTNNFGFYSLTLPREIGDKTIFFSYMGFETQVIKTDAVDTILNIRLPSTQNNLDEVVISGKREIEKIISSDPGKIKLNADEINSIPAMAGETDVLKAIALLPGIKQGVDGSSGFYVRGGGADQNLVLLDGVPLYNPYHLWGFLSVFNADAINNIEITKGAFPARYGGRLSSVLDITMKEGNNQKWQKEVSIGLLSAKASISGPLVKDKSSIMISARRTYADFFIVPILKKANSQNGTEKKEGYNFTDLNLKYNYIFSNKDRLFVSGFFSKDKYYFDKETTSTVELTATESQKRDEGWGIMSGSVRWNHLFGDKLFLNTTLYYTSYKYYTNSFYKTTSTDTDIRPAKENSIEYSSTIEDFSLKQDYQFYPNDRHLIRFGLAGIYHNFKPEVSIFSSETDKQTFYNIFSNNIEATELSIYVEDDFELTKRIKINAGLHASGFLVQNSNYFSFQPRLSARFIMNRNVAFKLGYSSMTQFVHLLTSSGITQSSDLWVPSTDKVKPQEAKQLSIGSALQLGENYMLELDGYYKIMNNLIEYKDGANFLSTASGWEDLVAVGKGEAYGLEVFLKKNGGKLTGWLGYTLSWTNRVFDEINFGNEYPYRYDRRHDISIVGMYKFSEKWGLNGSWVFYTGNAVSVPTLSYAAPDYDGNYHFWSSFYDPYTTIGFEFSPTGIIENYASRNNYRLPDYHRLDVAATRKVVRKKSTHELSFGLTNLYNRSNPSFYRVSLEQDDGSGKSKLNYYTTTLFPLMPTISYKILF